MISRLVGRWFTEGTDPDPRFTLANERTFLAWVRTSLALLAGGIGLDTFVVGLPDGLRRALAASLIVLGAALAVGALSRWVSVERAMREQRSLPSPGLAPLLSAGVVLIALALLAFVVVTS